MLIDITPKKENSLGALISFKSIKIWGDRSVRTAHVVGRGLGPA